MSKDDQKLTIVRVVCNTSILHGRVKLDNEEEKHN